MLDNTGNPHLEVNVKSDDSDRHNDAMQVIANRISAGIVPRPSSSVPPC